MSSTRRILLGSIALEPNRWSPTKQPVFRLSNLTESIKTAGFDYIEVWQFHVSRLPFQELLALATQCANIGIACPAMALYPDLGLGTETNRELFEDLTRRASVLGVEKFKIFAGNRASASVNRRERAHSLAQLEMLVEIASRAEITVSAELHENTLCDSAPEALRTLRDLTEPVGLCFQPLDFSSTEATVDDYQNLASFVEHLHLQGQKAGAYEYLADSDIDYSTFLRTVRESGYGGDVCIEFVKGCVVEDPSDFDLKTVMEAAIADRQFTEKFLGRSAAPKS